MSLATRCTSCGTVFRVVQDQLRVSEGWVRCGRCDEVFNALEGLFDLQRENPAAAAEAARAGDLPEARAADASDPQLVDRIDAALFGERRAEPAPVAPPRPDRWDGMERPVEPGLAPEPVAAATADDDPASASKPDLDAFEPTVAGETADADRPNPAPDFVRDADRSARWKKSRARMSLFAAALLLALALAAQAGHHFRDLIAARWPAARTALATWCAGLGCRLEAPRRIQDVSVESTTLTRAADPEAFRLSVTLRNRGTMALALPSVDLTLTDTAGQLVARRALAPADFRVASTTLAPGAESALQLTLSAGTARVTGYTVEIFYP